MITPPMHESREANSQRSNQASTLRLALTTRGRVKDHKRGSTII